MIEFHRLLLGDRVRNDAFEKAIRSYVKPGKTVVADIGSGTGFLAFLASKAGAKECHLFEMDPDMAALSRALAKRNGITNCRVTAGHSADIPRPPKVDLIVSETLGNYALEEGIVETMNDAVKRFLAPDGAVMPCALRQYVVPVTSDRLWKELNIWPGVGFDLDFTEAEQKTLQNVYVREIRPADLLKDGTREWDSIDFHTQNDSVREREVSWTMKADTVVTGFCLFWEADLTPDITLSTSPDEPMTHWQQIYLPVLEPIQTTAGDMLTLGIRSDTRPAVKINLQWDIVVTTKAGKKTLQQRLDMKRG